MFEGDGFSNNVMQLFDNIFEGETLIDNGRESFVTHENVHGGEDIFLGDELYGVTMQDGAGGKLLFDDDFNIIARITENQEGGNDVYSIFENEQIASSGELIDGFRDYTNQDGNLFSQVLDINSGYDLVMSYDNPLAHIDSYVIPPLIF